MDKETLRHRHLGFAEIPEQLLDEVDRIRADNGLPVIPPAYSVFCVGCLGDTPVYAITDTLDPAHNPRYAVGPKQLAGKRIESLPTWEQLNGTLASIGANHTNC